MTDIEIIKALEYIADTEDYELLNYPDSRMVNAVKVINLALGLINRQKAEIERLKYNLKAVLDERADHSEAIKEFAGRVKEKVKYRDIEVGEVTWDEKDFDNLVKEMVGEDEK